MKCEEKRQIRKLQQQPTKRMIMFAEGNVPSLSSAGKPSICSSFKEYTANFNCFTANALRDLDWSNVLAAGGACTACLLPVDKRTLRAAWFDPSVGWEDKSWLEHNGTVYCHCSIYCIVLSLCFVIAVYCCRYVLLLLNFIVFYIS